MFEGDVQPFCLAGSYNSSKQSLFSGIYIYRSKRIFRTKNASYKKCFIKSHLADILTELRRVDVQRDGGHLLIIISAALI